MAGLQVSVVSVSVTGGLSVHGVECERRFCPLALSSPCPVCLYGQQQVLGGHVDGSPVLEAGDMGSVSRSSATLCVTDVGQIVDPAMYWLPDIGKMGLDSFGDLVALRVRRFCNFVYKYMAVAFPCMLDICEWRSTRSLCSAC